MRKMLLSTLVCVAFASSAFASNEVIETKCSDERCYCDLRFSSVDGEGGIVFETKRVWGFNLNCDKEQAKVDAICEKRIANSKSDFRDIVE